MENPIFLCGWSYFIWIAMAYLLDFSECDIKGGFAFIISMEHFLEGSAPLRLWCFYSKNNICIFIILLIWVNVPTS